MCIALPGRITRITVGTPFPMATVDVAGTIRECCLIYVPEATVGDYTIIHAGFALRILDEPEALATLALFAEFAPSPTPSGVGFMERDPSEVRYRASDPAQDRVL